MLQPGAARRDADAAERLRSMRERLEAAASGLGELELLRQRQEVLVRTALDLWEGEEKEQEEEVKEEEEEEEEQERRRRREAQLSSEEKILEENILLLRKQLNCLRRRDTGLLSQLQELDRQISDLRLDPEESHDQPETDSRPSSGFFELSDGASGSLSNSSNSVFSECFCSTTENDGRLPSADELASCLDCDDLVGGLCDDSSFCGTVRRSLSAPHPPTVDSVGSSVGSCESKYHCDLVTRNGGEVYRYPSPLHAVAVQSPVFLQKWGHGGHGKEEGTLRGLEAAIEGLKPESLFFSPPVSASSVPQSSSWPAPSSFSATTSQKQLDSYIFSLLQRRALPVRTNRPRTSISTDPSKSILRQTSLCVRQVSGPSSGSGFGTVTGAELRPPWLAAGAEGAITSSPQRQWSVESKSAEQEAPNVYPGGSMTSVENGLRLTTSDPVLNPNLSPLRNSVQTSSPVRNQDPNTSTNILLKPKGNRLLPPSAVTTATRPKDLRELSCPKANSSPKETKPPCYPDQELSFKSPPAVKLAAAAQKNSPKPPQADQTERTERVGPDKTSEDAKVGPHMVDTRVILNQKHNTKLCKGGNKNVKSIKVKNTTSRTSQDLRYNERGGDKSHHRSSSKKNRMGEDGGSSHGKTSRRAAGGPYVMPSSQIKCLPASIPEGQVLDKHTTSTLSSVQSGSSRSHRHRNGHHHYGHHHQGGNRRHHAHHHNLHGRDQVVVVAKPKYKRNDYRRLRAIMEVPYDEAFRRAQRRKRKELLSHSAANGLLSSPYAYTAGSDSEYSAECASLFHSTIADTSEDERSNYTTNRFGDSESSEEEYVEESTATSDTEESGGGGAGGGVGGTGRGWVHSEAAGAGVTGKEMTAAQAKAFVKIKASHNLKRKILRFRSGSLKLMTTV
ncbi:dapper homolog 1 [Xyrichtys novacula]|uniref:Dapper homolog 1 n=1 Tax=Xyrichtys novacula TaxID=13765 RepID=A0AAV1GNZ7_XYRNO|nr:dapper homolog 1 [Xyrichtys novacula]